MARSAVTGVRMPGVPAAFQTAEIEKWWPIAKTGNIKRK
jgi:hypothetical protein